MVSLLERLDAGELVSDSACQEMLDHLYACDDRTKIARLLPPGTKVAHKSGAVSKSRTDAGLIDSPSGRIAICVLTDDNEDRSWADDNAANVLCSNIAKAAYDYFNPSPDLEPESNELAIGAMSRLVESLQRTLNDRLDPSPNLSVDGDFGPATKAAVKTFQKSHELPASGVVDEKTWSALGSLVTEGPEIPAPDVVNEQVLATETADELFGQPFVSCKAWIVADARTGESIAGMNEDQPLDPASTTKIMTAFVVLDLARQDPDVLGEQITFSKRADDTHGSTSGLLAGEQVTVRELLYGLLLPSGNDASVALAEHFGQRFTDMNVDEHEAYTAFVARMNAIAKRIGMKNSRYMNTHGLTEDGHLLTARDLAVLTCETMKEPLFREIVATRQFGCIARGQAGYSRNVKWENTNRLLEIDGYDGVKTGTTDAAGACLVSCGTRGGQQLITVVLGAPSTDARYADTRNLFRWAWNDLAK
jgi:D-alanyl-D-alanine carboxypeptidase (penicillin-binding protein 5/6)